MRNILILLIFIAIGFARFGLANEPAARYQKAQIEADQLYNEGHYSKAFKQYRNLAKKADVFSQYRVSYMYLMGQGVEEDLPEAFAWAVLAAQNRDEQLRAYRDTVKDLVPVKERRKAQRKADYYFRRWGKIGLADEARKQATTELRNETPSVSLYSFEVR